MNDVSPTNLPRYSTRLIGRHRATAAILEVLREPSLRWLTLHGQSGAGKTRLALEVADAAADMFPDGRHFVALAPVTRPQFVLPTIAAALGIAESPHEPLLDALAHALEDRQTLMILDNFEQVEAAAGDVAALLERTTRLVVLVTSQVPLGVRLETAHSVPPLDVPPTGGALTPAALIGYTAVALFVDRMQARQPRFLLTSENAPALVDICRLVGGLPLAIELIAAHSASLTPNDLLFLVRNHLMVASYQSGKPSRKTLIYPVLSWGASILSADAKALFAQLAVFAGGCTLESIAAVSNLPGRALQQALGALVDRYLVQEETLAGLEPRYIMIDAIREYALDQLKKQGSLDAVRQRHADFYQRFSEQARDGLRGAEGPAWIQRVRGEVHNIREAIEWSLDQDGAHALAIAGNLYFFWYRTSAYRESVDWLGRVLSAPAGQDMAALARAATGLGGLLINLAHYDEAERWLRYASERWAEAAPSNEAISALANLAMLYGTVGRLADSEAAFEEALRLSRAAGDRDRELTQLHNLGTIAVERDDLGLARDRLLATLELKRALGRDWNLFTTESLLGGVLADQGDYAGAADYLDSAFAGAQAVGDQDALAFIWYYRGGMAGDNGDLAAARQHFAEAQRLWRDVGSDEFAIRAGTAIADTFVYANDPQGALDAVAALRDAGIDADFNQEVPQRLAIVAARAALLADDVPAARRELDIALRIAESYEGGRGLAPLLDTAAWWLARSGRSAESATLRATAAAVRQDHQRALPPAEQTLLSGVLPAPGAAVSLQTAFEMIKDQ